MFVASAAAAAGNPAPVEIVKNHIEVEVAADGSYAESRETIYRILNEQGAQELRQLTLSYTQGYQNYTVAAAYTLKKDGTRIDVDRRTIMRGYGATSAPGFRDLQTLTVVFPNVEIGDEVAVTTLFKQIKPWFGDSYSEEFIFSSDIPAQDVVLAVTAPSSMTLQIDAVGMTAAPPQTQGEKSRREWRFANDASAVPEPDAVDNYDRGARLVVSAFKDYRAFAGVYADMIADRAEPTHDIQVLADQLTDGVRGEREKARVLYEWVSMHVAYLNIVLGAGGFVPHRAADVLANRFGDCKDHVILLEALLAAEGIASTPVLISADNRFTLSPSPSPYAFNHLITYVPRLHLYLDSTARYAPFGVLPYSDAGKPVIHIDGGETAVTPAVDAGSASIRSVETLTIAADGSIDGETHVTATGAPAVDMRAIVDSVKSTGEANYFHQMMGPGIEATLDSGNVGDLTPTYRFSAHYHQSDALNVPGPAPIPYGVVYKPFAFTSLLAGNLPQQRLYPYVCMSMQADEDLTIHLPDNLTILALPKSETLSADETALAITFTKTDAKTIHEEVSARVTHPRGSCSPAYYARVRATLVRMTSALRAQILYQ